MLCLENQLQKVAVFTQKERHWACGRGLKKVVWDYMTASTSEQISLASSRQVSDKHGIESKRKTQTIYFHVYI